MMSTPQSGRDLLKGALAITAAASIGEATTSRRAHAQTGAAQSRARLDGVLRQAVDAREVPGVDPSKRVTGLIMMQILPFADQRARKLYGQLERGVYDALKAV